jgi:hypothetical protein
MGFLSLFIPVWVIKEGNARSSLGFTCEAMPRENTFVCLLVIVITRIINCHLHHLLFQTKRYWKSCDLTLSNNFESILNIANMLFIYQKLIYHISLYSLEKTIREHLLRGRSFLKWETWIDRKRMNCYPGYCSGIDLYCVYKQIRELILSSHSICLRGNELMWVAIMKAEKVIWDLTVNMVFRLDDSVVKSLSQSPKIPNQPGQRGTSGRARDRSSLSHVSSPLFPSLLILIPRKTLNSFPHTQRNARV